MKIITIVTTNPIFIELQYKTIKKFIKSNEEIEFIVFNDSKDWPDITNFNDVSIKTNIVEICKSLGIQCINIPNSHHINEFNASKRHADSMNFITEFMINNKDKYLIIDNDMFFVDKYDLDNLDNYYVGYVEQIRIVNNKKYIYPWPNLLYLNTLLAPNLDILKWDVIEGLGLDTGGKAGGWLLTLEKSKIKKFNGLTSGSWNITNFPDNLNKKLLLFLDKDPRNTSDKYFAELFESKILHYRGGSNWMLNSKKLHNFLTDLLYKTIELL
jgi:hypothetical protein